MSPYRVVCLLASASLAGLSLFPSSVATAQGKEPAANFATNMLKAVKIIHKEHLKPTSEDQLVRWAVTGLFDAVQQPTPPALARRVAALNKADILDLFAVLKGARDELGQRQEFEEDGDIDIALQAIFDKLEPGYKHPRQKSQFPVVCFGPGAGVGLHLQLDPMLKLPRVVTPTLLGPAHKAGVWPGDVITKIVKLVDAVGTPLPDPEEFATKDMPLAEVEKLIVGHVESKIRLIISRSGKEMTFDIVRDLARHETVLGVQRREDNSWDFWLDAKTKIAYVCLTQFSDHTHEDLQHVVKSLHAAGCKGLILDLRFNPGGLLDMSTAVADLFIEDGLIVSVKKRSASWACVGKKEGSFPSFAMTCLINDASASGSEVVAACLQDHGRAILVGERSAGNAHVWNIHTFGDSNFLKMASATFGRPNGKEISKLMDVGDDAWGVRPDTGFAVALGAKERDNLATYLDAKMILRHEGDKYQPPLFEDRQRDLALEYLRKAAKVDAGVSGVGPAFYSALH